MYNTFPNLLIIVITGGAIPDILDDFGSMLKRFKSSGHFIKWVKTNFPAVREESIYGQFVKNPKNGEVRSSCYNNA